MLEPQSRTLLLDALKPPPERQLDFAVGTTFSLDLVALLAAPLAFALLDRSGPDGKVSSDPIALLEALRRNADRFAIFCQVGRIAVPRPDRLLLSYLERNVLEVTAPQGGVFHPKVWVMRFVAENQPAVYRVICASRNLTFDRSWDTALVLEGELVDRQNAYGVNHPLGDFVAALPGLAVRAVPEVLRAKVDQFQAELRRVAFELPEGFEEYHFWPLGIDQHRRFPFRGRIDRLLVVSPFVCPDGLSNLKEATDGDVHLVSRLEELQCLSSEALDGIAQVSVFSDEQPEEDPAAEGQVEGMRADALEDEAEPELSGLHAKLYVADEGWEARVWTGSANATAAAFRQNVEFLVELKGKKSVCGIDAILSAEAGQTGFKSFLKEFVPLGVPDPGDAAKREAEQVLDTARLALSRAGLWIRVEPIPASDAWRMELVCTQKGSLNLGEGVEVRAWPISCKAESTGRPLGAADKTKVLATFSPLTFEALTSFMAFELKVIRLNATDRVQFVLNLPAEGFPEDRAKRLLLRLLDNREAIMRYIQLLLDAGQQATGGEIGEFRPHWSGVGHHGVAEQAEPLLEPLVRALYRDPQRLDDVARLVEDLKQAGAGAKELPARFEEIWLPIWEARKRLADESAAS